MNPQSASVISSDGTRIAFWRSGSGPALLLVHGAASDHATAWSLVEPALAQRFTVYAMDRRGRGASGDGPAYALQREAEDIVAVVESVGEPVDIVAHSYGALCTIEAALMTSRMRRLVLYEGVPLSGADYYAPGILERLEALLAAGDVEAMLLTMMREVIQRPEAEIEMVRSDPAGWEARLRNAPSMPRELRTEQAYVFQPARFRQLNVPTLLLVGGSSPPGEMANARGVAAVLPDARIAVLPEQRHTAMISAPDLLVQEITRFLV